MNERRFDPLDYHYDSWIHQQYFVSSHVVEKGYICKTLLYLQTKVKLFQSATYFVSESVHAFGLLQGDSHVGCAFLHGYLCRQFHHVELIRKFLKEFIKHRFDLMEMIKCAIYHSQHDVIL